MSVLRVTFLRTLTRKAKMSLASDRGSERIQIDGSILEGGGQILRNASAYACILRKAVEINNIRGKRSVPGLKLQHLCGLQLLTRITAGTLEGGRVESREILLRPGSEIHENEFVSEQGAGSVTLVFQSALPVLLFSPYQTRLTLRGGTNVSKSPPIDYTKHILLPFLKHFGVHCDLEIRKRGFASYGGGEAFVMVHPSKTLKTIRLNQRGNITSFKGLVWTARQEHQTVIDALQNAVTSELRKGYTKTPIEFIRSPPAPSHSFGMGMLLYAETSEGHRLASSTTLEIPLRSGSLSKQEVKARQRGQEMAKWLLKQIELGGVVDEYLADQIIIFMALATSGILEITPPNERCEVLVGEVSLHTETAMRIAEKILNVVFSVKKQETGHLIECIRR